MTAPNLQSLYMTTFSQVFSPDSSILAVGTSLGTIAIYEVKSFRASGQGRERARGPSRVLQAHQDPIYSLEASEQFCIAGAAGEISGRRWAELDRGTCDPAWKITLEYDQSNFQAPEVNGLAYDSDSDVLYAACGDWRTHVYDLETGRRTMSLEGHEDYVHDVICRGNSVVTCGEDGIVLVWDVRTGGKKAQQKVEPHKQDQLARPRLGKYIAAVDLSRDWLVCGGGPRAGIFHLRSNALTTVLPPEDAAISVTRFTASSPRGGSGLLIGGALPHLYCVNISGDIISQIPCSSTYIYSVAVATSPSTVMCMGGASSQLDVCLNLNYRDHTVSTVSDTDTST